MEEALWRLEEKWKVSTHKAIALFACTSFLLIGACLAAAALRRRSKPSVHQEPPEQAAGRWWGKWDDHSSGGDDDHVVVMKRCGDDHSVINGGIMDQVGWESHNSSSGVWQRPILMGEKCELPRFSGLILYDQKGMPLHDDQSQQPTILHQEMSTPVVRTTLRDLL